MTVTPDSLQVPLKMQYGDRLGAHVRTNSINIACNLPLTNTATVRGFPTELEFDHTTMCTRVQYTNASAELHFPVGLC